MDRRLTEGGVWRQILPDYYQVVILETGVDSRSFIPGGKVAVRFLTEDGRQITMEESEFILIYEPMVAGVSSE